MSTLQVAGESIPVNAAGYLTNFDDWSEDVAREIADLYVEQRQRLEIPAEELVR